jgi:hypothetical protein
MKHLVAVSLAVLATAVLAPAALADNGGKLTLGPAGYSGPGNRALVLAGSANVVLGDDDHVVICHAIGGPRGTDFNQIAPSASGVVNGHGGHEADRDIIPPFALQTKKGADTSLASGQNWNAAGAAIYANGCNAPATPPPPPTDACPNIAGVQTSIPAGMTKDASGNCVTPPVTPPTDVCSNIEGVQTSVPAGMTRDAAGNCATPPVVPGPPTNTTVTVTVDKVTVDKVVVNTVVIKKVVIQKQKAKAKKVVKKAKKKVAKKKAKIKVKAAHKVLKPSVLPHTR